MLGLNSNPSPARWLVKQTQSVHNQARLWSGITTLTISVVILTSQPWQNVAFAEEVDAAGVEYFEKHIRPVLVKHCYECHSADTKELKGGLLVDTESGLARGGDSGPAVVAGDVGESLILEALKYESYEMPPQQPLPKEVVAKFESWIKMGAPDPRKGTSTAPLVEKTIDWESARQFWSFQPPDKHDPPVHSLLDFDSRRIDAFIAARLESEGLAPAEPANRRTYIRRVTFDLTGLPPTPEEVESFVKDEAPRAYERLIERLLSTPQYGERWARPWLDLARYAEDQAHIVGNNKSLFYPNAYLYRDWVINALNSDMPYDEFIKRQLASDLIAPDDIDNLAALGFMGLGPKYYRRNDLAVMADEWEDRVDTLSRGLQGLTVACARCHDHKYDPITTQDYYGLAGVFASTEMYNRKLKEDKPPEETAADSSKKPAKGAEKKKKDAAPEQTMHIVRDSKLQDLHVFIRGNVESKGDEVPRRYLQILASQEPTRFKKGSGRLELAELIISPENPLTARVIVNRVWAQYFGRGIVGTPSNFGELGERPSHPELLDDLAVRFMESGWSLKWLHQEIVLSDTYRQSSLATRAKLNKDPSNTLLSHMPRRRLPIEAWRDSMLSVTGQLDDKVGGPSIDVADPKQKRRTVYSKVSRFDLNGMLAKFDFPDPNTHAAQRAETITPLQKLFTLNSQFATAMSVALADRIQKELQDRTEDERIEHVYGLLFARLPSTEELELGKSFVESHDDAHAGWTQYAQVLLASNEFQYVD